MELDPVLYVHTKLFDEFNKPKLIHVPWQYEAIYVETHSLRMAKPESIHVGLVPDHSDFQFDAYNIPSTKECFLVYTFNEIIIGHVPCTIIIMIV